MDSLTSEEAAHLRRAISLAAETARFGNRPFGAVLAGSDGTVLAEGSNTVAATGDLTAHAESVALRRAGAELGLDALRETTMFASGEPCPMCTTAMYQAGVSRVVFGMPLPRAQAAFPPDERAMNLRTRDVLALLPQPVELIGPVLEDEAAAVFPG
ncbi:tRNA(Arg) A34 adenosine deaminase TadA [Halopolyspora algeriensis]|uniref:tRNA(Arg) A34 adenosine deaminase TadA n=1 Tax=Halopolyspora algeriensis TaxID=1500506 RepID=A0A368VHV1_9ACTN|nr:nucleoside deaminase [Halopolyspora algeriensis]RCW40754.1 tRNA(Arg) A34 adenosine deaminase TadA [Halopolyspora algeriensis]TQM53327.1 tRNA(Arg) A34 adenosine deaminase TadA [Halopolyspora algeriensis]